MTLTEKLIIFILSIVVCFLLYLLVNVIDYWNDPLELIDKMNDLCNSKWYQTYVYPLSWWLDSNNFRCQSIEYKYSEEYYKI